MKMGAVPAEVEWGCVRFGTSFYINGKIYTIRGEIPMRELVRVYCQSLQEYVDDELRALVEGT